MAYHDIQMDIYGYWQLHWWLLESMDGNWWLYLAGNDIYGCR